jgi:hypothetical protein
MPANNLALLIPTVISTIQETARNTGFILNGVARDQRTDAASQGQTVTYPELPDIAAVNVVPGVTPPDAAGATAVAKTLTLTNHKAGQFKLTGEDERGMASLGQNYRSEQINLAVQAVVDAIAAEAFNLMVLGAGQAFGTPSTDPFATTPNILVDAWKSLADGKAPDSGRIGILSTNHYASAAKLTQFQKLSEAPRGTDFAAGRLGMLSNFNVGYDQLAGSTQTTVAAGGYLVNQVGLVAGAKDITVDTGTGGFAAGDVITIAGSFIPGTATLAQYVVKSATATIVTLNMGLWTAVADNAAIVRIATHVRSVLAHPMATYLSVRPSAQPSGGDAAAMEQIIRDPVTGLTMRLAYYKEYHQGVWEVSAVYGGIVRRPSWVRTLIS